MTADDIAEGKRLLEWFAKVAPRRAEGRSNDFALKMDGISLIDLNEKINEAMELLSALLSAAEPPVPEDEALDGLCERLREPPYYYDRNGNVFPLLSTDRQDAADAITTLRARVAELEARNAD